MATLRVRNLDETMMRELRARAAKHRRSLSAEVLEILETELDRMLKNDPEFRRLVREDSARRRAKQRRSG
jgi:plasmid stability protein